MIPRETTPTPEQQQAIRDFVAERSEDDIDALLTLLEVEFPPDVVKWWADQWLNLLLPRANNG